MAHPPQARPGYKPPTPGGDRTGDGTFRGYSRGYHLPEELVASMQNAKRTSLVRSAGAALGDLALIGIAGTAAAKAHAAMGPGRSFLVSSGAVLVAAYASRGLECLVHEASHFNWHRRGTRLNDVVANVFAAVPVMSTVEAFRRTHLVHHRRFGSNADPDRRRYDELGVEGLPRDRPIAFTRAMIRRFPRYEAGWLKAVGTSKRTLVWSIVWHSTAYAIVVALAGEDIASTIWRHWIVALAVVLPMIRFVAEGEEHQYRETNTVFAATITNDGFTHRLLHPHGDGIHLVHHLFVSVPHHELRKVHDLLLDHDPTYRSRFYNRTRIFQHPTHARSLYDRERRTVH